MGLPGASRASSTTRRRSRRCTRSRRRARRRCPTCASGGWPARRDLPRLRVYCSEHTHSSIDKAVILLGLGQQALRKIPSTSSSACGRSALPPPSPRIARAGTAADGRHRHRRHDVVDEHRSGRARSRRSARPNGIWLHVDAAYAGVMAMVPEYRHDLAGRGTRRLARRQPAQVALHAVRSQRVLLPPHGRACGARSRWCPST